MDTIKEKDIQRACIDYLDAKRIMYLRLNSGDVFRPGAAGKMYKVKGCPKGTADLLILTKVQYENSIYTNGKPAPTARPIFAEFKSSKGKQTDDQTAFELDVEMRGYEYHVIRGLDELIEVLK